MDADPPSDARLTDQQIAILAALCRPLASGARAAAAATDGEIAAAVSLDAAAVEERLRELYREFGIADLPAERRRTRLAELALARGYGGAAGERDRRDGPPRPMPGARADVPLGSIEVVRQAEREAEAARPRTEKRSIVPYITMAILILVVIGSTLAISGIFNSSPTAPPTPSPAAFRTEVAAYCKQALAAAPPTAGGSRAERARGYLGVIEAMRGDVESLVQPKLPSIAIERFQTGLTTAANYTSDVAREPPAAGSRAEAKAVAELTYAAGQIEAGATGYELGHDCLAIGELVAASARNAAAP
ncbi:MAG: hypothetical protein JSU06_08760 [Actinobacteria bacterium]|nr:hypothetical protein [Actinomycetota bacterium]